MFLTFLKTFLITNQSFLHHLLLPFSFSYVCVFNAAAGVIEGAFVHLVDLDVVYRHVPFRQSITSDKVVKLPGTLGFHLVKQSS